MNPLSSPEPLSIDVGGLARRSVSSDYSHLVTRPTGRAVRLAIESLLAEAGEPSVSLVDFSQVTILDFSCADEVVARLLRCYLADDRPRDAFFLLRGVQEWHEEPIEAVLQRQELAAVAEVDGAGLKLLGTVDESEVTAWTEVERYRTVTGDEELDDGVVAGLERLVARRLVFRGPDGRVHALSHLVGDLNGAG